MNFFYFLVLIASSVCASYYRVEETAVHLDCNSSVRVICNIRYGGVWLDLYNFNYYTEINEKIDEYLINFKDNLIDTDPGFVDVENENFQLKDDSPAYKLGFKRI